MKRRDLILHGQTNSSGQFLIANKQEMVQHFQNWKNTFFTIEINIHKTQPLSVPLLVYYKKKVVADFCRAYFDVMGERYTLAQTDEKLCQLSPICQKETYNFDTGKWESETVKVEQLDNQQLVFFIEHLKELGAQEFGVYIDEPSNIIS